MEVTTFEYEIVVVLLEEEEGKKALILNHACLSVCLFAVPNKLQEAVCLTSHEQELEKMWEHDG
jgi:hypothetical protein